MSSFWIRSLLSGTESDLARGFRDFLQDVAGGAPLTEELLLRHLGRTWGELEKGFRLWMRSQYIPPPSEARMGDIEGDPDQNH